MSDVQNQEVQAQEVAAVTVTDTTPTDATFKIQAEIIDLEADGRSFILMQLSS
ncbi:MAG: hypothetical protein H6Q68_3702 [Firmicutes bacterium]|nr:hypothetical protein [Bacillota bacterium]